MNGTSFFPLNSLCTLFSCLLVFPSSSTRARFSCRSSFSTRSHTSRVSRAETRISCSEDRACVRVVLSVSMSSLSFDSVDAASASAAFSRSISCLRFDSVDVASARAACSSLIWSGSSLESSSLGPGIDKLGPVCVSLVMIDGSVLSSQAIGVPVGHLDNTYPGVS
jgi:hypothetical protein